MDKNEHLYQSQFQRIVIETGKGIGEKKISFNYRKLLTENERKTRGNKKCYKRQ